MTLFAQQLEALDAMQSKELIGTVAAVRGMTLLVDDLPLPIGSVVRLELSSVSQFVRKKAPGNVVRGEVIGFEGSQSVVMLFGHGGGIRPGTRVVGEDVAQTVEVGSAMLGRIVNGLGRPVDDGPALRDTTVRLLHPKAPDAMQRARILEPLPTGLRALDGLLTVGRGQRLGIFSAAGVGKSTLLGSMTQHAKADVIVVALIGERGREVREFIEESLGEDGRARSVVVVATGDESPLLRCRAAYVATTVAEHFRDEGKNVVLMMDSITRFAQAQRQIGLAVGEQPATRGYTPSVFANLPTLLERAGAVEGGGSITAFYTVLVEGDDMNEPISDAVRGILDGHVILSRKLAAAGHFPAIDILNSISRVANQVCDPHHIQARQLLIRTMAAYQEMEELINIGAYATGSNPDCDVAIALRPRILEFLQQDAGNAHPFHMTCRNLLELAGIAEQVRANLKHSKSSHPQ